MRGPDSLAGLGRAAVAAAGDVPVINQGNIKVFVAVVVGLIMMVSGLAMLGQHRKTSVRQQAEHSLSAFIAILMIAAGLASATILAWASGTITFFGSSG